ncbi:MAG TPA: hypothetical protein VGO11_09320 [Chthoniobacteraceae bacterium]|nr:hypothetical protein [Chthoniobacteraceae bacterium]
MFCLLFASTLAFAADAPRLEAIYPSGDTVPANHLKFYLHFSAPMREGVFLDHCRLLDAAGRPVLEPFRETELWTEDHRRLTLWLHPGRQKTGVNLNAEFGPVLQPGQSYTLVISGAWPTADGAPLGQETRKTFHTTPRLTTQVDPFSDQPAACCTQSSRLSLLTAEKPPTRWQIRPPASGALAPLEIRFPYPLDHALLLRCLRVVDDAGAPVAGSVATADNERTWRFTPTTAWRQAAYRVLVDSILEDLAGNSLARPFEVDITAAPLKPVPREVSLSFTTTEPDASPSAPITVR